MVKISNWFVYSVDLNKLYLFKKRQKGFSNIPARFLVKASIIPARLIRPRSNDLGGFLAGKTLSDNFVLTNSWKELAKTAECQEALNLNLSGLALYI